MLIRGVLCAALALFMFSCSALSPVHRETPSGEDGAAPPRYSIVCIVHGDGGYLYHDPSGQAYRADEKILAQAKTVAERNPQAEVFIFHEKRKKHFLLFFPRHDGEFYYYRYGRLFIQESYRRDQSQSRFDPEVELYHRFHTKARLQPVKLFLYFGHGIPEFGGTGYDASYPDRTFTVNDLADGLQSLTPDSSKFDLLVLATCYNGTPHTISTLAPYARYVIASPENLHLSYFDLRPFESLDIALQDGDLPVFARQFARQAFDRLTEDVLTAVTVAVYDVERVREYLQSVENVYDSTLITLQGEPPALLEHGDCAEDSIYALPGMSEGVEIFYRPPLFGRWKLKQSHSGWECWRRVQHTSN
jgi:hypothetical protein